MRIRKYNLRQTSIRRVCDFSERIHLHKDGVVLKLYDKGSILLGQVIVWEGNWISYLVVNPKYRGKGYGKKLIALAEKEIFKKYKTAKLIPQDNDESLRLFYSKLGYSGFLKSEPGYEEEDKSWWEMTKRKD